MYLYRTFSYFINLNLINKIDITQKLETQQLRYLLLKNANIIIVKQFETDTIVFNVELIFIANLPYKTEDLSFHLTFKMDSINARRQLIIPYFLSYHAFLISIEFKYIQVLNYMTQMQLQDPFANGALPQTKIRQYEKALFDFKNEIIAEDKQISNNQTTKLKEFIRQIQDIKNKVSTMRVECQPKNIKLKQEIDLLETKLQGFQIGAKNLEMEEKYKAKIGEEQKVYLANCQKRVQIADSIDYKRLKKLQIEERKSLANEIFRWILVAVYTQPENKFYWPNFKEQVIENAEGSEDLKQRLGKFNAYNARQQQRVKTIKFIEAYEKIRVCPQLKGFQSQVEKIYQIAKIFLESSDIGRKVKQYEKEIEELRKTNLKDEEVLIQSRKQCDALTEKYRLSQLYFNQLTKIQKSLQSKLEKYNKEVELAESYLSQISDIALSKLVTVEPKEEAEKRQHCECTIF